MVEVKVRGNPKEMFRDEVRALAKASTLAVRRTAFASSRAIANEARKALRTGRRGAGQPLDKTLRVKSDPARGYSLAPTSRVYSKAVYRKGRSAEIDLLAVFEEGAIVRARHGQGWLAIPTENAPWRSGRGGVRRAQPSEAAEGLRKHFAILPAAGNRAVIIDRRTKQVLWVLVRQVRIRKRLNIAAIHEKQGRELDQRFLKLLDAEDRRLEAKYR